MATLRGLRRLAPFKEPQSSEWFFDGGQWGEPVVHSASIPPFAACEVSGSLTPTTTPVQVLHELSMPASNVLDGSSYDFDVELYDSTFDLIDPVVVVTSVLPSLGSPTTQGSLFLVDESQAQLGGAFSESALRTRRAIPGAGRSAPVGAPKGIDLFAMLLPVLMPPASTEFSDELLFPGQLYDYQRAGVRWLFENEQALLADDMGLGKTVQAITAFRALVRRGLSLQALVICPKSLITNWQSEISKWAPELTTFAVQGPAAQRAIAWKSLLGKCHVLVATYETIRSDSKEIAGRPFDLIICDEVQRIKNPTTDTSQAVRALACRRRWALTGTPLENSAEDLASIFNFIRPGLFARGETKGMSARGIQERIRPFMLRRRKQDVLKDLPPLVVDTTLLDLSQKQRVAYDRAEIDGVMNLRSNQQVTIQHVLALIGALKLICNFEPQSGESSKVDYLKNEFLPEACTGDQKALVVSQYVQTLTALQSELAEYEPLAYTGSMTTSQRDRTLSNFADDDAHRVLLLSLKAGGVGLNLTRANYLMHFDRWWNPAIEDQASARIHRIGQTRSVFVSRLVCKDTIEERIEVLLEKKRILFAQVVDELSDVNLQQLLSEEELFGLFNLKPPRRAGQGEPTPYSPQEPPESNSPSFEQPIAVVIDPKTPYSNVIHLREVVRNAEEYLYWADQHFRVRALEEIAISVNPAAVRQIKILSGHGVIDDKARREFKRFAEEMSQKGVVAEWRTLDPFAHDRYIVTSNSCFNVPPVGSLFQGQYAEILETPNRPPFDDWWSRSVAL